jgi:hypothetical protein
MIFSRSAAVSLLLVAGATAGRAAAQTSPAPETLPTAIAAPGATEVTRVHAIGAQIYECGAAKTWVFREPIAALMQDGKTVGRHFAGPSWEFADFSAVVGKAVGSAPGTTVNDVAWLKLSVSAARGTGILTGVTTVQRIDTAGGQVSGPCDSTGALRAEPYTATYVFLRG